MQHKKILGFTLAIFSAFVLVGCGNQTQHHAKKAVVDKDPIAISSEVLSKHTSLKLNDDADMYEGVAPKDGWGKLVISGLTGKSARANGTIVSNVNYQFQIFNGSRPLSANGDDNTSLNAATHISDYTDKHSFYAGGQKVWSLSVKGLQPLREVKIDKFKTQIIDYANSKKKYGKFTEADIAYISTFTQKSDFWQVDTLLRHGSESVLIETDPSYLQTVGQQMEFRNKPQGDFNDHLFPDKTGQDASNFIYYDKAVAEQTD